LLKPSGARVARVDVAGVESVALARTELGIAGRTSLGVYDPATGHLRKAIALGPSAALQLAGITTRLALLRGPHALVLVRLSDGAEISFPLASKVADRLVDAKLTAAGLFYAYNVAKARRRDGSSSSRSRDCSAAFEELSLMPSLARSCVFLSCTALALALGAVAPSAAPSSAPSFTSVKRYATGIGRDSEPRSVAVGDFNGDRRPDLVTANDDVVSVLINRGGGSFRPKRDYIVGAGAVAVATGHLNGDGHVDLAVAAADAGAISVLINRGDARSEQGSTMRLRLTPHRSRSRTSTETGSRML
jgi:hypothetical protein